MKKILIAIIRLYQKMPLKSHSLCRFTPTCSEYAIQAIEEHGAIKGTAMALKRVSKCRPGGGHGFDPVSKKEKKHEKD